MTAHHTFLESRHTEVTKKSISCFVPKRGLKKGISSSSCAKHGDYASVSVAKVMWAYKGDMNSASEENWKEPSTSTDVSFNVCSNEETFNINKTCWQ